MRCVGNDDPDGDDHGSGHSGPHGCSDCGDRERGHVVVVLS